jgi:glycosyltransferase involved in cell wall biosynthesis
MNILHLDSETSWRGGQNQILELAKLSNQKAKHITHHIFCPPKTLSYERFSKHAIVGPYSGSFVNDFLKANKYIKEKKITTLVAHTSKAHLLGLVLKKQNPNLKYIVYRKVNNPIKKGWLNRWKYLHPEIDFYIAVSKTIKNTLISGGVDPKKVHVVFDLVTKKDPQKQKLRDLKQRMGLEEGDFILSSVGFLDQQKNHITLIKALRHLTEKNFYSFKCFIAGEGPLKGELQDLIHEYELESNVKLLGFIDEVTELLALSDFFIFPSINEGLGSSVIDAINQNCFIIASQSGGVVELIEDRKTGLLFQPKDHIALANAIIFAKENKELCELVKKNATERIRSSFEPNKILEKTLKVFEDKAETP